MHCFLHIGPPKTGSSSIQLFLRDHLEDLAGRGFFIPKTQRLNMAEFQILARDWEPPSRAASRLGIGPEADDATRARIKARLRADLAGQFEKARASGCHAALISNEGLGFIGEEAANLHNFLAPFCDGFTVIPVLRRQDLRAVSGYKNQIKNWLQTEQDCFLEAPFEQERGYLTSWQRVFGAEALRPILFPDSVDGARDLPRDLPRDLIADFCDIVGISGLYDPKEASRYHTNQALDGRAIEVLRLLNILYPDRKRGDVPWGLKLLEQKLEDAFAPPLQKVRPGRAEAMAHVAKFEAENEAIRARYFPDQAQLFSKDFSRYPEEAIYPAPSAQELVALLGDLVFDKRLAKSRAAVRGKKKG